MNHTTKGLLPARVHKAEKAQSSSSFAAGALWGMAFCAISGLALIFLGALIAYLSPDPDATRAFFPAHCSALAST